MPASTAGLSGTLTAGLQEENQDSGVGCPGLKPAQGQECCWRVGAARMLWFVCTAVLSCHKADSSGRTGGSHPHAAAARGQLTL